MIDSKKIFITQLREACQKKKWNTKKTQAKTAIRANVFQIIWFKMTEISCCCFFLLDRHFDSYFKCVFIESNVPLTPSNVPWWRHSLWYCCYCYFYRIYACEFCVWHTISYHHHHNSTVNSLVSEQRTQYIHKRGNQNNQMLLCVQFCLQFADSTFLQSIWAGKCHLKTESKKCECLDRFVLNCDAMGSIKCCIFLLVNHSLYGSDLIWIRFCIACFTSNTKSA